MAENREATALAAGALEAHEHRPLGRPRRALDRQGDHGRGGRGARLKRAGVHLTARAAARSRIRGKRWRISPGCPSLGVEPPAHPGSSSPLRRRPQSPSERVPPISRAAPVISNGSVIVIRRRVDPTSDHRAVKSPNLSGVKSENSRTAIEDSTPDPGPVSTVQQSLRGG
jgi:hypothetical protein